MSEFIDRRDSNKFITYPIPFFSVNVGNLHHRFMQLTLHKLAVAELWEIFQVASVVSR